jgi:hypothetical protein
MTNAIQAHDVAVPEPRDPGGQLVPLREARVALVPSRSREELTLAALLLEALEQTAFRAQTAELDVERLDARVRELETWIHAEAKFDEVEHVQIGRLLAAAEARRIERLGQPLVSIRTALLLLYAAVLTALAALILTERVL